MLETEGAEESPLPPPGQRLSLTVESEETERNGINVQLVNVR